MTVTTGKTLTARPGSTTALTDVKFTIVTGCKVSDGTTTVTLTNAASTAGTNYGTAKAFDPTKTTDTGTKAALTMNSGAVWLAVTAS